jgi:predicted amidophosphoribosyltransferase
VTWREILDVVFPAQCAACNALGSGLCDICAPPGGSPVRVRLGPLRVVAYGCYEGVLRSAVLAVKEGRRDVAEALGDRIAPLVREGALLVPVPTTAKRRRVRGTDGVALIAEQAARRVAGASAVAALEQRAGDAQRGRSRGERLAAHGRFVCDRLLVCEKRVTLVDDVCTTGATLEDCERAVSLAGGRVEGAVVVAATKTGPPWKSPQAQTPPPPLTRT